jgi:DUF4097 and DUF4098 domain-containing protein YvlB
MLAVLVAASLALAQQTDTTVPVQQGSRLRVDNHGGEIVVRTWNQNRVRVAASHSSRDRIGVSVGASVVRVNAERQRGMAHLVDYAITVPAWMPVELGGVSTHIVIDGVQADVRAETVEGDITLTGGSGNVSLGSVSGEVVATGVRGRLKVTAVDGSVRLTDVAGDVTVDAVDGDIVIQGAQSGAVDLNTVDGDVYYAGALRDGGRYRFATHDGTITVGVPVGTNATVSVATFSGDFDSSFPVMLQPRVPGKRRFSFTLGSGSARLELETFDGRILLRRPNEMRAPSAQDRRQGNYDRNPDEKHDGRYERQDH